MDSIKSVRDIIQLPIFKCKICEDRFRQVFQVGTWGNICDGCYERSAYTDATRNWDFEDFLERLYVPCNFTEHGCSFRGSYYEICRHESQECRFRRRLCPFAYVDFWECGYEYQHSKDIITHIHKEHSDSVLELNDNLITIVNPFTESYSTYFYFCVVDQTYILIRARLIETQEHVKYAFYHFDEFKPENVDIFSRAFDAEKHGVNIMHESRIYSKEFNENAIIVPISTLKQLDFAKKIEIRIEKNESPDKAEMKSAISEYVKCEKCFEVVENVKYCITCKNVVCQQCISNTCRKKHAIGMYVPTLIEYNKILCENPGCNQIVSGDLYEIHYFYQCHKVKYRCTYENCEFEGSLREYVQHVAEIHRFDTNQHVSVSAGESIIANFINGDEFFLHTYSLTEANELEIKTIKLTEPFWTNEYIWIITVKSESIYQSVTVQGDYTSEGYKKKYDVGQYVKGLVVIKTCIKRI